MAVATVTVTKPSTSAPWYHRITLTGPTNGDIVTLFDVYTAIQTLADAESRAAMELINENTYSIRHITALNSIGTYTQFYTNANTRLHIESDTMLAFSQSSTVLTNNALYQNPGSQITCSAGSIINTSFNSLTGSRQNYFYGAMNISGSQQKRVIISMSNTNFWYNNSPSTINYLDIVDNVANGMYLSYAGISYQPVVQFKNIRIYNQNLSPVGVGINIAAGGFFPNIIIDGLQVYNKLNAIVNGGSTIKIKNSYLHDLRGTAISLAMAGGVVSPAYQTSKDDTRFPSGRFQPVCTFQNCIVTNFGQAAGSTYYGMLINNVSYVYLKNCSITRNDGTSSTSRPPLLSNLSSLVLEYGTGSYIAGHPIYKTWGTDGTFLRVHQVNITVQDQYANPISNSTVTAIQGSVPSKQRWSGITNAEGKLVNIYGDPLLLVQKQEVSSNSFQAWSDGSSEELKHIFTFTAPGYEMYQTTSIITQDKNWVITLYPPSQPSVATDTPGIQIGQGIVF